jgi:hypothetical protein
MAKDLRGLKTLAYGGTLRRARIGAPELEWLANLTNPHTRRAYKNHVDEFVARARRPPGLVHFSGLGSFAELRGISRAHVIAWRKIKGGVSLIGERWS